MTFPWRRIAVLVLAATAAVALTGCPEDPFDPDTWIKKLDNSNAADVERAVTELERLGENKAIPALGKAWEKQGRPERILRVIIDLSRPLTEAEAKAEYKNNYKARPPAWDKSLPILTKAVEEVDGANPRSVESARLAAEALGRSKVDGALEVLVKAANESGAIRVLRREAILALGELGDPRGVAALANIIREDFDPQKPEVHGAALIALRKIKSPEAVPVLIDAMYRLPFFFKQVRGALVASGDGVADRIRAILLHEDKAVNDLFAENKYDTYCGDLGKPPVAASECVAVSAMDYYAAIIAGDLYDPSLVPALLKAFDREVKPAYLVDFAPGPPAQNAVLDALRKIGQTTPEATQKVLDVWATGKNYELKPMAANVYSMVSHDGSEKVGKTTGVELLGKIAADNSADQSLRLEAAVAYARLSWDKNRIPLLLELAGKYAEAAAKAKKEADGAPKANYEKLKIGYDAANEKLKAAKKAVQSKGGERRAPIELINEMTEAKVAFDKLKPDYTTAKNTWKALEDKSKAYTGYQRLFETHVARVEIGIHCQEDPACYAATLYEPDKWQDKWTEVAGRLKAYIKGLDKYGDDEKKEVLAAQIERAMIELGKMGARAHDAATDALLKAAKSDDRIVRQSVLLALPKVAGKDCKECGPRLDEVITASQGKDALRELTFETEVLRAFWGDAPEAPAGGAPAETP